MTRKRLAIGVIVLCLALAAAVWWLLQARQAPAPVPTERQALPGLPPRYGYDPQRHATFRTWIERAVAESQANGGHALVIDKAARTLNLLQGGRPAAMWRADLSQRPVAQKVREGDRATPEGFYRIARVKDRGETRYYRAYLLDYPTEADRQRTAALIAAGELPPGTSPGSLIEIHGHGGWGKDWTLGCVAVPDRVMDELFDLGLDAGTPVVIVRYGMHARYGGAEDDSGKARE
jgi:murein L,D-transpeptidase YafK